MSVGYFHSDFIRKVIETFTTRVLVAGISLITSILLTRLLGPEGRGNYAVAIVIGAMGVQFGNLGLHAANTFYVSKDRGLLNQLVGNTLLISFGFGGLVALFLFVVFTFLVPHLAPVHGTLLALSLFWIPFGLASVLLQHLLLGINEIRTCNKIELTGKLVSLILTGLVACFYMVTPETVFSSAFLGIIVVVCWSFWRLNNTLLPFPFPSLVIFKKTFVYSTKAYMANFFAFLVFKIDLLMIKYILNNEEAGFYSVAVSLADLLYMLPPVVVTLLFPRLAAIREEEAKWYFTKKVAFYIGIIMAILSAGTALFAEQIICLIYGRSFVHSVYPLILLTPGIAVISLASIYSSYIASNDFPIIVVHVWFVTLLINIILNIKLICSFGIAGASMSSTFCYGFCFFMIFLIAKHQHEKSICSKVTGHDEDISLHL